MIYASYSGFKWYSKELNRNIDITDMKTLYREISNYQELMDIYKLNNVSWHTDRDENGNIKNPSGINQTGYNYPREILRTKRADCLETSTFSYSFGINKNIFTTIGIISPYIFTKNKNINVYSLEGHAFSIFKKDENFYIFNYMNIGIGELTGPYDTLSKAAKEFTNITIKSIFDKYNIYKDAMYFIDILHDRDLDTLEKFLSKEDPDKNQSDLLNSLLLYRNSLTNRVLTERARRIMNIQEEALLSNDSKALIETMDFRSKKELMKNYKITFRKFNKKDCESMIKELKRHNKLVGYGNNKFPK